jgi:hypothetical protein
MRVDDRGDWRLAGLLRLHDLVDICSMRRLSLFACIAGLVSAVPGFAATVTVGGSLPYGVFYNVSGAPTPTPLSRQIQQTSGPGDLGVDLARSSVDASNGLLRAAAREGGRPTGTAAGATAQLVDRITINAAGPIQGVLQMRIDGGSDTLFSETGDAVGGRTASFMDAQVGLYYRNPQTLGPNGRVGSNAALRHVAGHFFTALNPSVVASVTPWGTGPLEVTPTVQTDRLIFVGRQPVLVPNPVQAPRVTTLAENLFGFDAYVELPFTANPGDEFEIDVFLRAQASGAPGHYAFADMGNTARLGLILPEGASFTSESGLFLATADPLAVVPLPAPAVLLASGIAALGAIRHRQHRRR